MAKFAAQGVVARYGAAVGTSLPTPATDTFTDIGQIVSISGPSITKGQIEVTTFDDAAKTFLSDLSEPGTLDFTILLDTALTDHGVLFGDVSAQGRTRNFQLELPDTGALTTPTEINFVGEVLSWSPSFEQGSAISVELSVQVSGAVSQTARA
jgi:hypothetical protein